MNITKKTDGAKVTQHSGMFFNYKCTVINGPAEGNSCGVTKEPMYVL